MATTAVEVGKPGTNWKQVSPEHRRKIAAIVNHYMKSPHPFTACVRDNRKRFGPRTEAICAVVKDMGERTTKWRKGGKGGKLREAAEDPAAITAAAFDDVIAPTLDEAGVTVDELAGWVDDAQEAGILVAETVDPADLSDGQLVEAAKHASARLAILQGRDLPTTGDGATYDLRLVEASADVRRARRTGKPIPPKPPTSKGRSSRSRSGARNSDFEGKHPRDRAGNWIAKGASGAEVRAVQRRVGARVDGDFGDKTKAAVERFQRKNGLTVDGVVGRQTVAALRGRKDAKRVKTGNLTDGDRTFLRGHVKGKGGTRRRVVEAASGNAEQLHPRDRLGRWRHKYGSNIHGGVTDAVRKLKPGESHKLPDGTVIENNSKTPRAPGGPTGYHARSGNSHGTSLGTTNLESMVNRALDHSAERRDSEHALGGKQAHRSADAAIRAEEQASGDTDVAKLDDLKEGQWINIGGVRFTKLNGRIYESDPNAARIKSGALRGKAVGRSWKTPAEALKAKGVG